MKKKTNKKNFTNDEDFAENINLHDRELKRGSLFVCEESQSSKSEHFQDRVVCQRRGHDVSAKTFVTYQINVTKILKKS